MSNDGIFSTPPDGAAATRPLEDVAGEFAELELQRRELERKLKDIEQRQAPCKSEILRIFQERSMKTIGVRGMTIYLHRARYAGLEEGADKAAGCAALRAAGLGELVTEGYNSQSVSARLREFADKDDSGNDALPPELAAVWKLNDVFDVRARLG